ncbi:MAG: fimbrillin family protein [Bacteroidales bacterium]
MKFLLVVSLILIIASCEEKTELEKITSEQEILQFSTRHETELSTKASGASWDAGDAIGIYMKKAGEELSNSSLYTDAENVKYITTDGAGNFLAKTNGITLPTNSSGVDFIAYYPYQENLTNNTYSISTADQSNQTEIDLLYSNNACGTSGENGVVSLYFSHLLSQLTLQVSAEEAIGTIEDLTISIAGLHTEGACNLANGIITRGDRVGEISPFISLASANSVVSNSILMPGDNLKDAIITFRLKDDIIGTWSPSSCLLESKKKYTYELVIQVDGNVVEMKSLKTTTAPTLEIGQLNVMTFNILWDKATSGPKQWSYRRASLINLLDRHNPDIIGVQEAFKNQARYISTQLEGYDYIGYGMDDGKEETEAALYQSLNPIFYNRDKFSLLDRGVFWYSNNPSEPNIGFSEGSTIDVYNRMCVWAKFKETAVGGSEFYVFNTHWSTDEDSRIKGAELMLKKLEEIAGKDAVIICVGDYNAYPGNGSYEIIANLSSDMALTETKDICSTIPSGPVFSNSGFEVNSRTKGYHIDHVFARNIEGCVAYKIIADYEGDYYPSDHFPVLSILSIK